MALAPGDDLATCAHCGKLIYHHPGDKANWWYHPAPNTGTGMGNMNCSRYDKNAPDMKAAPLVTGPPPEITEVVIDEPSTPQRFIVKEQPALSMAYVYDTQDNRIFDSPSSDLGWITEMCRRMNRAL